VLDTIRALLRQVDASGEAASIGDEESLLSAGVIDSTAMIDLISAIEGRFEIQLHDEDMTPENFDTVVAIRDLIQRKLDGSG
jgi:acyl carrier protein